jgi:2-polyprenyl-6-hydroxyphenyl methylase/3-demethylubiquinone-9 3-methyltransferase
LLIEHGKDYVIYRCPYCHGDFARTASRLDYHGEIYKAGGDPVRDSYKLDTLRSPREHLTVPVRWYIHRLASGFLGAFPAKGKLLDVGCGAGAFAKMTEELGFEVYAFDPAEEAIKYAREKLRLKNTIAGTIEDIPPDWHSFDVISAIEVIEHVESPRELVSRIYELLKPGGHFIVSVPNRNRLVMKFWGVPEWDVPPNHLTRWSKQVLVFFLADLGFVDVQIRMDDLHRRSLSVFLPSRLNQKIMGDESQRVPQEGMSQGKSFRSSPLWKCVQKTGDGVAFLLRTIAGGVCNRYLANSLIAVARKPGEISHH